MTKIPPDDILKGFYKLRIQESEKLKTVLELYNMEIHQKKLGPDYHRLKAMVKRSIEQEIRNKNFEARSGNFEKNAVVKNQGTKQREQRTLGECWQWKANGQCFTRDNCSFRHDMDKRGKRAEVPVVERLNGLARITFEELAITHFVKNGTLQNACSARPRAVVGLGKSAHSHIVRLMNSRRKGLKRIMTKVQ